MKSRRAGSALFGALIVAAWRPAWADSASLSGYAATYLLQPISVRAAGLGDAYTAVPHDSQSLFYNLGGLGTLRRRELGSMFSPQDNDQRLWSSSYVQPLGRYGGLGVGFIGQDIGSIEGRQLETDAPSSIKSSEGAFVFGYGYSPTEGLGLGIGGKYIYQRFSGLSDNASGFGADFGVRYMPPSLPALSLGAAAENLGARLRWNTGKTDRVVTVGRAGASYRPWPRLLAVADIEARSGGSVLFHVGLEAFLIPMKEAAVLVRVGADHKNPTLGAGFVTPIGRTVLKFDYAFELDANGLGDVSRMGFSLGF